MIVGIRPLLCLLLVSLWLGAAVGQEYTSVNLGDVVTGSGLAPCSRAYYTFDTMAGVTLDDFIQLEWTSNNSLILTVSDVELFADEAPMYEFIVGGSDSDLVISCPLTDVAQWYLTVDNPSVNGVPSDYTINFESGTVTVQAIDVDQSYSYVGRTFSSPDFATMYDFYSFDFSGTTNEFSDVDITVNSPQSGMSILISLDSVPDSTPGSSCVFLSGTDSVRLDSCEYASYAETYPNAVWYMAVRPTIGDSTVDYDVEVAVATPTVDAITLNEGASEQYTLTISDDVAYFSFTSDSDSEAEEYLSIIVANVLGGSVTVDYSFDEISLACAGLAAGSCTTDNYCEQVIDYCDMVSGTYYATVSADTFDTPAPGDFSQISFTIAANSTEIPDDSDLTQGELVPGTLANGYNNMYKIKDSGFSSGDDTLLNVHLYVDQTDGRTPTLYVNPEEPGGASTGCNPAFASCQVVSGSCTIQISPCDYNEYGDWYATVGSGSADFFGNPIAYTIAAELVNPYEFATEYLVFSSVVFGDSYSHFTFNSDLLPRGGQLTTYISNVSGGELAAYVNRDSLAGQPCCYDYTQVYRNINDEEDITIRNCNDDADFYLSLEATSVFGTGAGAVSFTVTVETDDSPIEPEEELSMGVVVVGVAEATYGTNYTVNADSDDMLVIKIVGVNTDLAAPPITMALYNSTYLSCIDSQYAFITSCQLDSMSACSFVVEPCVLEELDTMILVIENPSDAVDATFNIEANQYSNEPIELDNGVSVAGFVSESEYIQYSFEADGDDTLLFEIYFDTCLDIAGNQALGTVYLNYNSDDDDEDDDDDDDGDLLYAGQEPCYEYQQTCSNQDKCAFALSSCNLKSGTFYLSVTCNSDLKEQSPLGYTLVATEKDDVEPVTLGLQEYYQLYDDQIVYNTFDVNISPSQGSIVMMQLTNVEYVSGGGATVSAQAAQSLPPSQEEGSCPCFDYEFSLTAGVVTSIDYCQQTNTSWTVRVTPTSALTGEELNYGLLVSEFTQTPATLNVGATEPGTVFPYYYQYYKLNETVSTDSSVVVSLTNISGGLVSVFVASDNPATNGCNEGTVCTAADQGCTEQLSCASLATDSFQYISVLGLARNNSAENEITFDIQVTTQAQPELQLNVALNGQSVPGTYQQTYVVDLQPIQADSAPLVTFSVTNINAESAAISFTMSIKDTACGAVVSSYVCNGEDDCDWEVPFCQLDIASGSSYFTITSTSPGNDMTFSLTATSVDIGANSVLVTIGDIGVASEGTASLASAEWKTFEVVADPASNEYPSNLFIDVTTTGGSFVAFYSFNTYAGPDNCNEGTAPLTVDSCCLQSGSYYVAVQNLAATTQTITVSSTLEQVAYQVDNLGEVSLSTPGGDTQDIDSYPADVLLPFSFTLAETGDFASFYYLITADTTFTDSFEMVSPAGPTSSSLCFTANATPTNCVEWFSGNDWNMLCNFPQCSYPLFYDIGPAQVSVIPDVVGAEDVSVTVAVGYLGFTDLTTVTSQRTVGARMVDYYTVTLDSSLQNASGQYTIMVDSDAGDNFNAYFFSVDQSLCGFEATPYQCTSDSQCTINYPTCEGTGNFYLVIENLENNSIDYDVTYGNTPAFNSLLDLPALNQPSIMDSSAGVDHIMVNVPALNATQWATFYVSSSNASAISVDWTYGSNGPYCFTGNDECAPASPFGECAVIFYDCNLMVGSYIFAITADVGSMYTYGFDIYSEPVQALTVGTNIRGEVALNAVAYYEVAIDRSLVQPGQSIDFSLSAACGEVELYLGEGAIAGGSCGASAQALSIDSCDLLTSAIAPVETVFYLTVVGTAATFDQYDVPVRYELAAMVTGRPHEFVPIGVQQPVMKPAANDEESEEDVVGQVLVFSVPGVGEFSGQLVIEAYLPDLATIPNDVMFFVGMDVVPGIDFCVGDPFVSCNTDVTDTVCSVVLDTCDLEGVSQLYIQWEQEAPPGTLIQVSHLRGFVRDLDLYDYNPQQGAVSEGQTTLDQPILDEEYYRISLDTSAYNFFLSATIEVHEYSARLMTSTQVVPSACVFEQNTSATALDPGTLDWAYCEIADDEVEMYFAVDTTYNFLNPGTDVVNYNLTVTRTLDTVNITQGVDSCYTIPAGGVYYFGLEESGHYTPGSAIEVTVHGVSSEVDVYVDGNGLASDRCTTTTATVGADGLQVISYPCPYFNEVVTAAVYNRDTQPVSFYLSWDHADTDITPITMNGASLNGTEPTYYSFAFPSLTGEEQLIFNAVGAVNQVYYAANQLPRGDCPLYMTSVCNDDGCAFSVSQCLYATTDTIYVYVDATGDFTATLLSRSNFISELSFDEVYVGSFVQTPSSPIDLVPVVQSFTIDVDQSDIDSGVFTEMDISIFGVNQATLTAVVARDQGTIPGTECTYVHASSFTESTVITIPACYLADAEYYLGLYMEMGGALTDCADVTFGILVTFTAFGGSGAGPTALAAGTSLEVPYVDPASLSTVEYYSFSATTTASQVVEIQTVSSNPDVELAVEIMFNNGVGMCSSAIATPVEYVKCNVPENFYLAVSATLTGSSLGVKPGSSYTIMASTKTVTGLTAGTAVTKSFETTAGEVVALSEFFSFDYDDTQSFNLALTVTTGPAVTVQLLSSECVTENTGAVCDCPRSSYAAVGQGFQCYFGECQVPIAWLPSDLASGTYYLQVTGYAPAAFQVVFNAGQEGTCSVPEESDFCDVDYAVWNYGSPDSDAAQNEAAEELYHVFAAYFTAETCVELTSACNDSLIQYTCGLAYPACDESGFQTSTCQASCMAVEDNCGFTFEEVGLASLSCSHNAYLLDDDSVCTDIYDVVDDGISTGWKIFLIILAVLVTILILALLVLLVAVISKKAYAAHYGAGGYDVIDESVGAYGAEEGALADESSSVAADGFADYGAVEESAPPASEPPAPPVPPEE